MSETISKILLEEYKANKVNLLTVSEDTIKADIVRKIIYRRADFISQGTKLVGLQNFNNLDVKYQFPGYMTVDYPVAEGARGEHGKVSWTDFTMTLGKGEGNFMITDEATVRGYDRLQYTTGVKRLSEAFAEKKDANIIDTLYAGKGNTAAAAATWDTATSAQITADIEAGIKAIVGAQGVTEQDIAKMALVLPIAAWAPLLKLTEIETLMRTTLRTWIQDSWGMSIHPTKNATLLTNKTGLLLIKGEDSAVHGTLAPPAGVPLVETERHTGVGLEYVVRQFFATKVVPDSSTVATSTRIYTITSIIP